MIHSRLIQKGVTIYAPETVYIDDSVDPDRIASEVIIHSGSRIRGKDTLICSGAIIGAEAPATVENCYIGPDVSLKGGFFKKGVFLKGASMGSGAHVREGTIFEEYASAAHQVGVKQTILFPFVTLGSLINFCDCLMSGGTGPKNHSEVGSSYIHFNFTPQQDKVTPSLLGDVAGGVMLNRKPIFLGGQGGLVGPARLAFGTVIAAGTICRTDELRENRLLFGGPSKSGNIAYSQDFYRNIRSVVYKNLHYMASLTALSCWYTHVRSRFVSQQMPQELFSGLKANLGSALHERVLRLTRYAEKMGDSAKAYEKISGISASEKLLTQKRQLHENREQLSDNILSDFEGLQDDPSLRETFVASIDRAIDLHGKNDYVKTIQRINKTDADTGTAWLQGIVEKSMERWGALLPTFKI